MSWKHILMLYNANLNISHMALCVMHVLAKTADETNQSYPSMTYIAEKMNMSIASVKRGIKELGEAGLVIWKSGKGNRHVNTYQINVDKLSKLINNRLTVSHLSDDENFQIAHCEPLNGSQRAIKWLTVSYGREHKETKKLVSMCPTQQDLLSTPVDNFTSGQASSAEEVLVKPVQKHTEKAPSAPAKMLEADRDGQNYRKLVKTYGWIPKNKQDIEAIWSIIYQMGASKDEADRFIRFNSAKNWNCINRTCSVKMIAHLWIDAWKRRDSTGYGEERKRREDIKRRELEEKMRKEIEMEQI